MFISFLKSLFFKKEEKIKLHPIYISKEAYNDHMLRLGRDYHYTKNCFNGIK